MATLRGCGTALVTPFTTAGAVDLMRLRALVEWQVSQGIDFLVPCGSTGEAQTLDEREREAVVRLVVDVAAGRVPVMAGATSNDTRKAVEETKRMAGAGADWILSAAPYYNKPTPAGLEAHFLAVAEAATVPVCVYNIPGRAAVNMPPDLLVRLAQHPQVRAVKESSGDLQQVQRLLLRKPASLAVLAGDDWIAPATCLLGGAGLVSVASNAAPAAMRHLVQAALDGRIAELRSRLASLLPLMDALFLESNPGPVKAALARLGRIENALRLPLVPVLPATETLIDAALAAAGLLPA